MPFDRSPVRALAALGAAMLLQACAGFVIHDEARSKIAADTKQSYTDLKVTAAVDADRKNLETMLAAELAALRASARLQSDIASLELANNTTPMGFTFVEAKGEIATLGLPTIADLRKAKKTGNKIERLHRQLANDRIALDKIKIPDCKSPMPAAPVIPDEMSADDKASATRNYSTYKKHCEEFLDAKIDGSGTLQTAYADWKQAQVAQDNAVAEQKAEQAKLKQAKADYDKLVKDAGDPAKKGQELAGKITKQAEHLAKLVEAATKLDKDLEHEPFIDALVDLLTAAAGGNVDPKDPDLEGAIGVAKQIPALAGDIEALKERRKAPPVAGLLVQLRHQTLLAELAKQRAALAAERVAILKLAYELHLQAADRWLEFFDATCHFAVLGDGGAHPGAGCDRFDVIKVPEKDPKTAHCSYNAKAVKNCLLEAPWKKQLRADKFGKLSAEDSVPLKRELYDAVAAYLRAIDAQARPLEQSFKEIDVLHRETLLAKKTAIEQWDNLVSVPLDQLEAYYKAGVKPAEIADLIVKALGFTAIAIGVSK